MQDQQISNQRRTHTVRFLCCFTVTIASNIEACVYLSSAIFCRHCRYVRSDLCHGSTISSADFLRKLNHAHKSWPTLSIVWLLLYSALSASTKTDGACLELWKQTSLRSFSHCVSCSTSLPLSTCVEHACSCINVTESRNYWNVIAVRDVCLLHTR